MRSSRRRLGLHACALAAVGVACGFHVSGCAEREPEAEPVGSVTQGQIIGDNDLVPIVQAGANVPAKYRPLLDAFGQLSGGCTATHVGHGVVLTAGHCFNAPTTRVSNAPCRQTVKWGVFSDRASYLTSSCLGVIAAERSRGRDYALLLVSPAPPVHVEVDVTARRPAGTTLTIFGHPDLRPLEWSQTCSLTSATTGSDWFYHDCDTEPGSSGSTVLDDATLRVVGIHDGASGSANYATFLAGTPLVEVFAPDGGMLYDGGALRFDAGRDATADAARDAGQEAAAEAAAPPAPPPAESAPPTPTTPPLAPAPAPAPDEGCGAAPRSPASAFGAVALAGALAAAIARRRRARG